MRENRLLILLLQQQCLCELQSHQNIHRRFAHLPTGQLAYQTPLGKHLHLRFQGTV